MTDPTDYGSVDGARATLDGSVLRLELDRPDKRNAMNDTMFGGLADAVDRAGRDEAVRVIVISGAGDHFCGGADIVARNAKPADGSPPVRPRVGSIQRRVPSTAHRFITQLVEVQTPVVCQVRGWAAGIGFQIALAADFTVAAVDATFWEPFTERGFTPDSGATWLLPRVVGITRARELLLLGRSLTGAEAAEWDIVHRAVPPDELAAETEALISQLAQAPTVAVGFTKWLLHASHDAALAAQLQNEALALELSSRSEDFREGLKAFGEKRPPRFEGR
jgi:2-(1,2-epoxy-1,2-dihydrophenyl)acetyl-CoA isomerase